MDLARVTTVVIVVAAALLIIGLVLVISGRPYRIRRTAVLRDHFGGEYKRVIAEHGRRQGEAELCARVRRRRTLSIRRLDENERAHYAARWDDAERSFVSTPATGLREADLILTQVIRDCGYPMEGFNERAALISVDYPDAVEHFRTAHRVALANESTAVDTEEVRRAIVDYRFLFDELLERGEPVVEPTRSVP